MEEGTWGTCKLRFLLDHERNEITCIADDEAGIGAIENTSVSLFLNANLREEHSRCEVGIAQASLVTEVIKTFDQLLDLLLQKVTPHKRPIAMQTAA